MHDHLRVSRLSPLKHDDAPVTPAFDPIPILPYRTVRETWKQWPPAAGQPPPLMLHPPTTVRSMTETMKSRRRLLHHHPQARH